MLDADLRQDGGNPGKERREEGPGEPSHFQTTICSPLSFVNLQIALSKDKGGLVSGKRDSLELAF